jgi:hypothetical protein
MNNVFKAALVCCIFASSVTQAQQSGTYTEWLSTSSNMNWSSGMVTAEGFGVAPEGKRKEVGRLLACRAAVTDAQRNLIEATNGVRVTVSTSVSKFAADYDIVKTAVEGSIQGASILSREMGEDSTCKVTMGLFIGGDVSNSIYRSTMAGENSVFLFLQDFVGSIFPVAHAQVDNSFSTAAGPGPWLPEIARLDLRVKALESNVVLGNASVNQARKEPQPTGLIIDVRGHRFLPSMSPEILHPGGQVIYPNAEDKDTIVKSGKLLSLFSRGLDFALNHPIVGDKPLLIKASSDASKATSILLSKQNADKLQLLAKQAFFAEPRVIIILD